MPVPRAMEVTVREWKFSNGGFQLCTFLVGRPSSCTLVVRVLTWTSLHAFEHLAHDQIPCGALSRGQTPESVAAYPSGQSSSSIANNAAFPPVAAVLVETVRSTPKRVR
jgi:hypothetical protein